MALQRLRPDERLRRPQDYLRCYRKGRRRSGRLLLIYSFEDPASSSARFGLTASRKVGGAVVRNRLKRRVRELFRCSSWRDSWRGFDVVVHFQPAARSASFAELREELAPVLSRRPVRR